MASSSVFAALLGACMLVGGCARSGATASTPASPRATGATVTSASLPATGRAHALVILATSCWLGGLWSDAVGEQGDARDTGIRRRCESLLRAASLSPGAYDPLRTVDPATVDAIAARTRAVAEGDPVDAQEASTLDAFLRAVAGTSRETVHARRAADKVKQVFETFPAAEDRRANKVAAAPELRRSTALHSLLLLRGPYAEEARVIATLHALDRLQIAYDLPKHLKIYAVGGPLLDLFGVPPPPLPEDASLPIRTGTWLAYLTSVAAAAGHPVPSDARDPQNREPLAWNGVLTGIADKLREVRTDPELAAVATGIVERLDEQQRRERAVYEALPPAKR